MFSPRISCVKGHTLRNTSLSPRLIKAGGGPAHHSVEDVPHVVPQ